MAEPKLKRRLFVATGLLAIAAGAWWLWSSRSIERAVAAEPAGPQPFVQLASGAGEETASRLLRERALYFDPTPLFLPTSLNFGQGGLPRRLVRQPGQIFESFAPKLHFPDALATPYAAELGLGPENLPELLGRANEAPFAGLGESGRLELAPQPRAAFIEVKSMLGERLEHRPLAGIALPRAEFAPMEFIIAVGPAGVIGKPMLAVSSGWEDVDAFFRDYLTKTYRIGERLAPGRYRVLVGP